MGNPRRGVEVFKRFFVFDLQVIALSTERTSEIEINILRVKHILKKHYEHHIMSPA